METTTAVCGATAVLGPDLDVVSEAVVVVEGDQIVAAGARAEVSAADAATVVDATGLTLVPGFIDAHVHIAFHPPGAVLSGGVTTARDLGWPPERIFPLVERSRAPSFEGPHLLAAGPILTPPGGYPSRAAWAPPGTARFVPAAEEADEVVAETVAGGASVVKLALNPAAGPTFHPDVLRAIIEAAHRRGVKTTAHVYGLDELEKGLAAGLDELAHVLMSPERIPDDTLERMVGAAMAVVSTLSIRFGTDAAVAIDNLARFKQAGGLVVYGTDLGNEGPRPGIDRREVAALSEAGLTPLEIVRAATVDAAAQLGLPDAGAIEQGRRADLVAVRGAPLSHALDLTDVAMVWRAGRRVR